MRSIGSLPDASQAARFVAFLSINGIECKASNDDGRGYTIWIYDDDQLYDARRYMNEFIALPQDPRFQVKITKIKNSESQASQQNYIDVRTMWHKQSQRTTPITFGLMALSILASLFTMTKQYDVIHWFYFADIHVVMDQVYLETRPFADILRGQIWRLVTPIFLHFGFMHIFFNMLWLKDLGRLIEFKKGSVPFALFVLITAILSNTAQYLMIDSPFFGGMSGVVYGMLGFVWMKSRYDPRDGFYIDQPTVIMMIVWYVLCLVGIIPNVANTVHTVGLVMGILWGITDARAWRRLF